jgi:hypothetical protein
MCGMQEADAIEAARAASGRIWQPPATPPFLFSKKQVRAVGWVGTWRGGAGGCAAATKLSTIQLGDGRDGRDASVPWHEHMLAM